MSGREQLIKLFKQYFYGSLAIALLLMILSFTAFLIALGSSFVYIPIGIGIITILVSAFLWVVIKYAIEVS